MGGVNKALILGRLGKDPEMTFTPGGLAVCKFSLATSRKDKNGNETTQWHRCTSFGKAAELISQYVSKGQELYVEGEIRYGSYEKDGITRYTTDIIVNEFNFISGGQQNNQQNNNNPNQGQNQRQDYQSQGNNQQGRAGQGGQGQQGQGGQYGGGQSGGYAPQGYSNGGGQNVPPVDDDQIPF